MLYDEPPMLLYSDSSWTHVLHGDWHLLQLIAEMLRDILWDGGLKQLSYDCGHKKLPTQWQEVHMLLLALHETLLRKAVLRYTKSREPDHVNYLEFTKWVSDSIKNQMVIRYPNFEPL